MRSTILECYLFFCVRLPFPQPYRILILLIPDGSSLKACTLTRRNSTYSETFLNYSTPSAPITKIKGIQLIGTINVTLKLLVCNQSSRLLISQLPYRFPQHLILIKITQSWSLNSDWKSCSISQDWSSLSSNCIDCDPYMCLE